MKKIILMILIICAGIFSSAQIPKQVIKADSIIKSKEERWNSCINSGIQRPSDFKKCNIPILHAYDSISKYYLTILSEFLAPNDTGFLFKAINHFDSMIIYSEILNTNLFGWGTSYNLGYESAIATELISKQNAECKYKFLRRYIISICERREEPCDLFFLK